ncbi:hypothetical protein FGIG_11808 [Fasciola gigantica]|uniref:Uncharacterized protein n=1 Tax=Fasciola gigantica TaxID=46835 RepID=A0A504YSE9_FASGI|nr:hypothetical protein FGIG_11808 [Fasciola gigantica]
MSTRTASSNLDSSAAEFVPDKELLLKIAKREGLAKTKEFIDPLFSGERSFRHVTELLLKMATLESDVNPPEIVGYALGQATLESSERVTFGFRIFKELRAQLPTASGQDLECGLFTAVHEATQAAVDENLLKDLQSRTNSYSKTTAIEQLEEAGDVPIQISDSHTDRVLTLLKYLNLLITRLNLVDSSDECTCVPPAQPCVDLCQIVEKVCRMQLTYVKIPSAQYLHDSEPSSDVAFDPAVLMRHDWVGLLYLAVDSFSQSLSFFSCFLTSLNQRVLSGAWYRTGSLDERAKIRGNASALEMDNGFEYGPHLSSLMNRTLTCMRELLVEERVPLKMIRSAILDTLMTASEMAAVNNITPWSAESYELPVIDSGSTESEGDDVYECFQKFLLETDQVPPS